MMIEGFIEMMEKIPNEYSLQSSCKQNESSS